MIALSVTVLFWVFFGLTLATLVATLATGFRGVRRMHVVLAVTCVALLTVTVVFAERMAGDRTFPPDEMRIHLGFAKSAAGLVLPVVASGIYLLRSHRGRRLHLVCVALFVLAALSATGTGIWVFGLSTPR